MISIIIPSAGSITAVRRLCDSILQQNVAEEIEVYVVANPDSRELSRLLRGYPSYFHYLSSERGANKARNQGIKESRGRYLFFFDDDCILPTRDYLTTSIRHLDAHPDCMGYGGPYKSQRSPESRYGRAYFYLQCKWLFEGAATDDQARYFVGGNMALRRELFEIYGPFTEDLKFGGTETEFFARLRHERLDFDKDHFLWHDYELKRSQFLRKAFLQGLGSRYIQHRYPNRRRASIIYGKQALLRELDLPSVSEKCLNLYRSAFHAGEIYYETHRSTQIPSRILRWELFKLGSSSILEKTKKTLDDLICIVENLRTNDRLKLR
ncbi:glycosyltransferase family 2 protein [Bdellovibrio sp. HCB2-146]|uniref:glycosyltransferase family 2 protein n=1 Tax=Bdellovibrio sp. HCB2-146 TaxID=3394362 RepID=UPI0039BD5743